MDCEDGCPYCLGECLDDGYRSKPMKDALDLINRQKAENERLTDHIVDLDKKVKSEAYREFADKLVDAFNKDINLYGRCTVHDVALKINNTLNELTESNE